MAYISTAEVKAIRDKIKAYYPNYKFSIRKQHCSTVVVSLLESPLIFKESYIQVNHYYLKEYYEGENLMVLQTIYDIITGVKSCYDRNAGDPYADYGDSNYFIHIQVGEWNKPYKTVLLPPKKGYSHIMTAREIELYQEDCKKNRETLGLSS